MDRAGSDQQDETERGEHQVHSVVHPRCFTHEPQSEHAAIVRPDGPQVDRLGSAECPVCALSACTSERTFCAAANATT